MSGDPDSPNPDELRAIDAFDAITGWAAEIEDCIDHGYHSQQLGPTVVQMRAWVAAHTAPTAEVVRVSGVTEVDRTLRSSHTLTRPDQTEIQYAPEPSEHERMQGVAAALAGEDDQAPARTVTLTARLGTHTVRVFDNPHLSDAAIGHTVRRAFTEIYDCLRADQERDRWVAESTSIRDHIEVAVRVKAWPAVPGVTVPAEEAP